MFILFEHILITQTFFKTNASLGFSPLNGYCIKFLIMLYFQVGRVREGEAVAGCSAPLPGCLWGISNSSQPFDFVFPTSYRKSFSGHLPKINIVKAPRRKGARGLQTCACNVAGVKILFFSLVNLLKRNWHYLCFIIWFFGI